MPVFAGDELIAWTANIAHWNDVGGMVPGLDLERGARDLPGGPAAPGGEADRRRRRRSTRCCEIIKVNSRMPDFLRGRPVGRDRGRASRRAAASLELVERYGVDDVPGRARRTSWTTASRSRGGAARTCRRGGSRSRRSRTAAQVYKVDGRDHRRGVRRRPARQPRPGPRARTTPRRDGAMIAAQMVFMNMTEPQASANAGTFRPLQLLTRPGSVFDAEPARRLRDLLRGRDPALRPDLALPRAAPRRAPAGRQLRLDLRHVHRRAAPRHRPALHDRRAAARRLGRLARRATATARSSAASTATPSTARPRSPRPATGCTSTGSR